MPTPAQIVVRNAVFNALTAATALAGGNVFKSRKRALSSSLAAALVVRLAGSDPREGAILGSPTDWTTDVVVEAIVRTTDGDAEAAAWALHAAGFARLQADSTLGGVVDHVGPPRFGEGEIEDDDDQLAGVVALYPIEHRTAGNSLDV